MPPVAATNLQLVTVQRLLFARPVFLVLGALTVAFCVFAAIDASKLRPDDGTIWLLGRTNLTVLEVPARADGPVSPLLKRDTINGIANQVVRSPREAAEVLGAQRPGTTVPYLIERDGRSLVVHVPLTGFRVADRSYVLNVLLALVYLLIGGLVYLKSGNDQPARLFFLLCLCFALYFMTNLERSSYFWGDILTRNGGAFARFFLPAIFLHFFLVFPERKQMLARRPLLAPLLYVLPLLFYFRFTLDQFFGDRGARIDASIWLVLGLYYVAGLAVLLHSYLSYRDPLLRERVRILTWGTLAGVLPFLVFKIGLEEINARTELAQLGVVPLAAIPVCFGYCVARYQVLQIDFLVKRSLLFAVLSGLLLAAWAAAVFWLGSRLVTMIGSGNPLIAVGVTLFVAAILWPVRHQLQRALEIRLYRSRANLAALLEQCSREIPGLIQQQALLDHVGRNLQQTLDLPRLWFYVAQPGAEESIWLRVWPESDDHDPAPTVGPLRQPPPRLELPRTLQVISERLEPLWIDPREARRTATAGRGDSSAAADPARESRLLAAAGIGLLVPLAVSGRVIGLCALPPRPGNETYQLHEIQLLTIVARQAALQLENTRLYAQELAKQTLEEEMRLARSIQSRLLPAAVPSLPGIQIDAVNLSSKTVSGDYYDVIRRQDGQLALIIADVSGKGMPASLLASNLQASLRAQCDLWDTPGPILHRINRQLHATTDSQHFATVFLAFLDPASRRLRYSTGGHDAPILLRAGGEILKLEEGGLPLGAFDFGDYDEGEVTLADGDLLLLYTDGLTETRSPDGDDEYGSARLDRFLSDHRHLETAALLPALERELAQFRGRREADDDITLIALKVAPTAQTPVAADAALTPAHAPAEPEEAP
jgi:phosphoserine phosphatase RsbU/P